MRKDTKKEKSKWVFLFRVIDSVSSFDKVSLKLISNNISNR